MEVIRSYYNDVDDLIRIDILSLDMSMTYKGIVTYKGTTGVKSTRRLKTQPVYSNKSGTPVSRVVDKIEVVGDFDSLDADYTHARWNRGDGTELIMNMTDLPIIGATV